MDRVIVQSTPSNSTSNNMSAIVSAEEMESAGPVPVAPSSPAVVPASPVMPGLLKPTSVVLSDCSPVRDSGSGAVALSPSPMATLVAPRATQAG
jgi:hypothetical protein